MKTKTEKLKQNNLSSKKLSHKFKKNWVANKNNERSKRFRYWDRKKERVAKKIFLPSKNFVSVEKY